MRVQAALDRGGAFKALKNALLLDPTRAETYLNLGNPPRSYRLLRLPDSGAVQRQVFDVGD